MEDLIAESGKPTHNLTPGLVLDSLATVKPGKADTLTDTVQSNKFLNLILETIACLLEMKLHLVASIRIIVQFRGLLLNPFPAQGV